MKLTEAIKIVETMFQKEVASIVRMKDTATSFNVTIEGIQGNHVVHLGNIQLR